LEYRTIHALAPQTLEVNNRGLALQRAVFAQPDLLPLYGSSELLKHVPDKASLFFANYPSGFAVSPIGRPGCTSLNILQKIATAAGAERKHKVAVILSPSWFTVLAPNQRAYAADFSLLQASYLMFDCPLSRELKQGIARRLLDYPQTLEGSRLLESAVYHAARGEPADQLLLAVIRPLGWLQNCLYALEDHCVTGFTILWKLREIEKAGLRQPERLPWAELLAAADQEVKVPVDDKRDPRPRWFAGDADFQHTLDKAQEWGDLELLLRTLRELHLDPLVISIPIERRHFEEMGITPGSIEAYEQRLTALAAQYRVPLADFADHEDDGKFFADHHDHLSAKGWMYFDKALDDFFHAPRRHLHPRRTHRGENFEQYRG
jgi:D-alanine transfer protein